MTAKASFGNNKAERRPLDVTIVLFDGGLSSTAIMPTEIFHSAGKLWNVLHQRPEEQAFRVRTVTIDGKAVRSPYGLSIVPEDAIAAITRRVPLTVLPAAASCSQTHSRKALVTWLTGRPSTNRTTTSWMSARKIP